MTNDGTLALFLMLGQSASRSMTALPDAVPQDVLTLSPSYELAPLMPEAVRAASRASEAYKLFFVFEAYLRELVVDVLSKGIGAEWWDRVPEDVRQEIAKLEETEEAKRWMALGSRDRSALMTYPQLLRVIDHGWKDGFGDLVRDKALLQEARVITHLRNMVCHMTSISDEEMERIRQVMRDWFRMVTP